MSVLAYIPARAGSKRIPRKNVRNLGGKPVLAHVIESIRRSGIADRVVVSTDDLGIKKIAESAGADVLALRSAKLSTDRVTLMELLKEDVPRHLDEFRLLPSKTTVLFTLATAALVDAAIYRKAYEAYTSKKASVLVATTGFSHSPFRALVQTSERCWQPLFPKKLLTFSQELPKTQVDAGLFYFLDFARISRHKGHWFNVPKGLLCHPVPAEVAVDVDTEEDWRELERKYRELHGTRRR